MPRKTYYGSEARAKLKAGVDALADAVKTSLGPKGRNSVIWRGYGLPIVTKDGVTIAKEIDPEDPAERMGAELVRQAAQKTNDAAGDGTTTSTVLAQELVRLALERLEADPTLDVHALRQQMESRAGEICASLDAMAVPVAEDRDRLRQVATISANNDQATGTLIADMMHELGSEGVVTIDEGHELGVKVDRVEGMRFARGYVSPYMMTDHERMVAELGDVTVIVTDYRVTTRDEIVSLVKPAIDAGKKDILLVAEALEGDALSIVVANGPTFKKNFNVVAVSPPGYGDRKKEMMQDLCALTGASLISLELGRKLDSVDGTEYGACAKITVSEDFTTIVGGKGKPEAVAERVSAVKAALARPELSEFDKEKLRERLGKLQGGVAVIRVGARTESEAKEKRYLIEDALNAVKAAMKEGIVQGAGMALVRASLDWETYECRASIVDTACKKPAATILANAGLHGRKFVWWKPSTWFGQVKFRIPFREGGYDAKAGRWVKDLLAAGIVDPVSVTKSALRNAVAVAGSILTTETLIVEIPEKKV